MKKNTSNKHLKKEFQKLEQKVAELENDWKRAVADYRNLERRIKEERNKQSQFAAKDFFQKLLPVFDSFNQARKHFKDEGLLAIANQLDQTLKAAGVTLIETIGKSFNPEVMEVVDVVESDKEGFVQKEVRSGYKLNGQLVRPAHVIVGKKSTGKKQTKRKEE